MSRDSGMARLDDKKRIALGSYTELQPGEYYRVTRDDRGWLTLAPVISEVAPDVKAIVR